MIEGYRRIQTDMLKPIQMTLLTQKVGLEFKYDSLCNLMLESGNIVKHYGQSSRKGWVGVVVGSSDSGAGRVDVIWLLDDKGKSLTSGRGGYSGYIGISQSYSQEWTVSGFRLCTNITNIYCHEDPKYPFNVKPKSKENTVEKVEDNKPKVVDNGERFILWSPKGTRNPKGVHTCEEVATKVAVEMTLKHNQQFYVCKLIVETKPLKKARIIKL